MPIDVLFHAFQLLAVINSYRKYGTGWMVGWFHLPRPLADIDFTTRPKYESVPSLVGCGLESDFARGRGK